MTMKTEPDEIEGKAFDGTLSRDRDPVVPRGSLVAGEDREVEGGAGELPAVAWRYRIRPLTRFSPEGGPGPWKLVHSETECNCSDCYDREPLTPLLPAQERIRELEAENEGLHQEMQSLEEEHQHEMRALEARLEEVRPVVRAALVHRAREPRTSHLDIVKSVDALSPAAREWAEGEGEEEG